MATTLVSHSTLLILNCNVRITADLLHAEEIQKRTANEAIYGSEFRQTETTHQHAVLHRVPVGD
jgi:hypothetical protein